MRSRQRGMSALGWMGTLVGIASIITIALKTIPHYIDYQTIVTIVEGLGSQRSVHEMSKAEIREALDKRFNINNIRDLDPKVILAIQRAKGKTSLQVNYERRERVIGNVDIVLVFEKTFDFS